MSDDAEARKRRTPSRGSVTSEPCTCGGPPDEDHPRGVTTQTPPSHTEPSIVRSYRFLRYARLSETANVTLVDYGPDRGLHMTLETKYIGPPRSSP